MSRTHESLQISPKSSFYKKFNPEQIHEIITGITLHQEIPLQFTYFDKGAGLWDDYTRGLLKEEDSSSLAYTIRLLSHSLDYIESLIENFQKVNIIDLGPGNALPIRGVLDYFLNKKLLGSYIAIDTSESILRIVERNIKEWFGGTINFAGHIRDLNHDHFDNLLDKGLSDRNINLIFFLGGTISNLPKPKYTLSIIRDSMGKDDILLTSRKLDNDRSRKYFRMTTKGSQDFKLVPYFLNIDESYYTFEKFFDEQKMARQLVMLLNKNLTIKIVLEGKDYIIKLKEGDRLLLWRARHQTVLQALQELDESNFNLLQATCTSNTDYLLTISRKR